MLQSLHWQPDSLTCRRSSDNFHLYAQFSCCCFWYVVVVAYIVVVVTVIIVVLLPLVVADVANVLVLAVVW